MTKKEIKHALAKLNPKEWDEMVEYIHELRAHQMVAEMWNDFTKSGRKASDVDLDSIEDLFINDKEPPPEQVERYMRKILKIEKRPGNSKRKRVPRKTKRTQ